MLPWQPLIELAAGLVEWLLQFLEWCALLPGALWRQHAPAAWSVAKKAVSTRISPGQPFRVESVRHFFNLAAVQVRRELLDLAKLLQQFILALQCVT